MNALSPFRSFWPAGRTMFRDMNEFMRNMFDGDSKITEWSPTVDVVEDAQSYLLKAEMPGMKPEDIQVTLNGDTLTISGEKHKEEKTSDASWQMLERYSGSFQRTFRFPSAMRQDSVEASLSDGVLTVRVLKATETRPAKIKVVGKPSSAQPFSSPSTPRSPSASGG